MVTGFRDLLDRFRPAGAPGPATIAGVPDDRPASVAAELEPVFAALAPVVARCTAIRLDAAADAQGRQRDAAQKVSAIIARAHVDAEAERASSAARRRRDAEASVNQAMHRATAEADDIRRRGDAGRPELVARALDRARTDLRAFVRTMEADP